MQVKEIKSDLKWNEDQLEMCSTPGWDDFMETVQDQKEIVENIRNISLPKYSVEYRRGQLDMIDWLLTWKDMVEKTYEELLSEQSEDI